MSRRTAVVHAIEKQDMEVHVEREVAPKSKCQHEEKSDDEIADESPSHRT
jgi:hypothetical protein